MSTITFILVCIAFIPLFYFLGNVFVSFFVFCDDRLGISFGCSTELSGDISLEQMPFWLWPMTVVFFLVETPIIFIMAQFKISYYIISLGKNPVAISKLFSLTFSF